MDSSINIAIDNLKKAVTCGVCLEFFSFPVSLSCGHSFCKLCIHNAMKVKSVCPICSGNFNKRSITAEDHLQHTIERIVNFLNGNVARTEVPPTENGSSTSKTQGMSTPTSKAAKCHNKSSSSKKANTSSNTNNKPKPPQLYATGDLVNVTARTWAGMNKPGGTGRVIQCNECEGSDDKQEIYYEYDIRYVLDGSTETGVNETFLEPYLELCRSSRKSRTDVTNTADMTEASNSTTEHSGVLSDESGKKRPAAPVYSNTHLLSAKRARGESPNLYWAEHDPVDALVSTSSSTSAHHSASKASKASMSFKASDATSRATASSRRDDVANPSDRRIVLLSTALDPSLQTRLQDLADSCHDVTVVNSFSDQVTHLVVSVDKRKVMQQRTMKYMQALISGIWVVTVDWVVKSLDNHVIQDEALFEVHKNSKAHCDGAPARARLAAASILEDQPAGSVVPAVRVTSRLFASITVLIFGQYPQSVPPRSDIQFLLQRGGAAVSGTLAAFVHIAAQSPKASKKERNLVVVCSAKEYADELYNSVVVVGSTEKSMREVCAACNICVVSTAWVLDSVGNYKIQPLEGSFE